MPLHYLRIFSYIEKVAEVGSIRKAAEGLSITASALDRRVQDVERELGADLFERHARGMRLTTAGELFLHHARSRRADFDRVRTEIEQLKGLRRGKVSVAASQALAFSVLPEAMRHFRKANPGVSFTVRICDHAAVVEALRNFDAELGLVYNAQPTADLTTLMEIEQRLCAVMALDHPLAKAESLRMRDCAKYPLALPDGTLGGRAILEGFFARSSLERNVVLESNSVEMLRNFVRSNDAITFQIQVGTPLIRPKDGVIGRHIDDRGLARGPLTVAQLRGRHLPLPALRFLETLRQALGADGA